MSVLVYFSDTANQHFLDIDTFWRSTNPARADLFTEELDEAIARLSNFPNIGRPHEDRPGVRQTLLRRSSCYVYYQQNPTTKAVEILALWNTQRGVPPPV